MNRSLEATDRKGENPGGDPVGIFGRAEDALPVDLEFRVGQLSETLDGIPAKLLPCFAFDEIELPVAYENQVDFVLVVVPVEKHLRLDTPIEIRLIDLIMDIGLDHAAFERRPFEGGRRIDAKQVAR